MKKLVLDPNNPASVVASVREFLEENQTIFQGMIDKVPEAFKSQISTLKAKVDGVLASMASKPTDQVPAALDAASALSHITWTLKYMEEVMAGTMEALNKMIADHSPKVTALQALQGRIDKKELLESTEVDERIKQAREEAVKTERERQKLLTSRRTILAKANVPLPVEDGILDGDEKSFGEVKTRVETRTKKLQDLGQLTAMNAEDLTKLIYGPDEQFNFVVKAIENVGKTGGSGSGTADPLVGAGGAGGGGSTGKPKKFAFA